MSCRFMVAYKHEYDGIEGFFVWLMAMASWQASIMDLSHCARPLSGLFRPLLPIANGN